MQQSSESDATLVVALPATVDLHARPAGLLVREASRFGAAIAIVANGRRASAKSILEVLALGATGGTDLTLTASGADAADALAGLGELIPRLA
ncbi:MAG: phosphocarrier protein HPr [Gaiellaceae bacterium]|nr:phosphocarrier protein HPr [Gaiellaceae bacterium]